MKYVILSADSEKTLYSVPDAVADDLRRYLDQFFDWLYYGPGKKRYWNGRCFCYNEADFIEYLNRKVFPDEESVAIENLGWIESEEDLPERYRNLPDFNF